jgi:hypothetical protein
VEPSETLSDCLFADEDEECSDIDIDIEGVDISCAPSQGLKDLGDLLQEQEVRWQHVVASDPYVHVFWQHWTRLNLKDIKGCVTSAAILQNK